MKKEDRVKCMICGSELKSINGLHLKKHGITAREYREMFPDADLTSTETLKKRSKSLTGKKRSEKTKKRMSKSAKRAWEKNPNIGRTGSPLSQESRDKLSKKLKNHPVSKSTRDKISKSGWGREPWNKGLTKDDDDRLVSVSKKIKKWNRENLDEDKKQRISNTLKKRYADGLRIPNSKNGYREDLDMSFRSSWEANYARILRLDGKKFEYEEKRFVFYDDEDKVIGTYTPDFKVNNEEFFTEIKGHATSESCWDCDCSRCKRDKNKHRLMKSHYPDIVIRIIGKKEYNELSLNYKRKIPEWENSSHDCF